MERESAKEKDLRIDQLEALSKEDIARLFMQLKDKSNQLAEREQEIEDHAEELSSQKEELNAAIEEVVSKNRSLEDTLRQLRDRSFELDQILYRTSHDLRSPLSSIKGILALLRLEPQSELISNYGKHIESKASQMDGLLRSLSSLSKSILEEPQLESIDLNKIIWQVVGEYRHLPSWNQVEVNVQLHDLKLSCDPALITIIFQSLFSNALIFRDQLKKGSLLIRTRQEEKNWVMEVIDDGDGITASVRPSIFDMFYRGSEKSQGSGLGLYVARKAADRMKGTISLHLGPGATCFTVTFPLLASPTKEPN